jgi:hypothetical protein
MSGRETIIRIKTKERVIEKKLLIVLIKVLSFFAPVIISIAFHTDPKKPKDEIARIT